MFENSKKTDPQPTGAASAAKSLFRGHILESNVFPYPRIPAEEADTVRMVTDSIDRFMDGQFAMFREFDRVGDQPKEFLDQLRALGLFGLIIPEAFDGVGLSASAYARVMEQLSRYDGSTSLTIGAHSSIGIKGLLLFGNEEQKQAYLPKLASGEMIAAFCLTEAGSGSDAASIKTHATKNSDGSWTLSGEKIWITNGAFADFFTVFARTDSERGKITAFIVERSWGGVESGPKEDKMGIRASATTTIRFDGVQVPAKAVLGEEGMGFKIAMAILNNGRTGLGGGCVGAMKRCIELAAQQSSDRKQFGKPIASFGLIQEKLARMTVSCFAAESIVGMVGHYIDSGVEDYSIEAAMSKIYCTEALWNTVNDALQIAGGNGFMREFPYERVLRDCRINLIFEGTNEILRLYIALSGAKEAGEYLKEIEKGVTNFLNDPIKGFGTLSGYASKRFSEVSPFGNQQLQAVHPVLRTEAGVLERGALTLSRVTGNLLRRYRKDIVDRQFALKRLAESATEIFTGVCVLSRVTRIINESSVQAAADEIRIAQIFVKAARLRFLENLRAAERTEDVLMTELANSIVEQKRYRWDAI